jgi:hypothetical protein
MRAVRDGGHLTKARPRFQAALELLSVKAGLDGHEQDGSHRASTPSAVVADGYGTSMLGGLATGGTAGEAEFANATARI